MGSFWKVSTGKIIKTGVTLLSNGHRIDWLQGSVSNFLCPCFEEEQYLVREASCSRHKTGNHLRQLSNNTAAFGMLKLGVFRGQWWWHPNSIRMKGQRLGRLPCDLGRSSWRQMDGSYLLIFRMPNRFPGPKLQALEQKGKEDQPHPGLAS